MSRTPAQKLARHVTDRKRYAKRKAEAPEALQILNKETNQKRVAKDPEKWRLYRKAWKKRNAEKVKAYGQNSRQSQPEKWKKYRKDFGEAHPGIYSFYQQNYSAKKRGAPVNDLTVAQWDEIKAAYGHHCVYCGRKMQRLEKDHITPVSKHGPHTVSNIVPACRSCNAKKHNGPPPVPVQPLLLTIAPPRPIQGLTCPRR